MENDEKAVVEQDGEEKAQEEKAEETKVENAEVDQDLEDFSKLEPEVRKRPIDYIEERKARRAERPAVDNEQGEEKLDEEGLTPKAREFLSREVSEALAPIKNFVAEDFNKREIAEVLSTRPEWAKYKVLAEKYMNAYEKVPALKIFQMIDYEYARRSGAEEAQQKEVQSRKARGGEASSGARAAVRKAPGLTAQEIASLSPQQVAELQKRLTMGESIKTQ